VRLVYVIEWISSIINWSAEGQRAEREMREEFGGKQMAAMVVDWWAWTAGRAIVDGRSGGGVGQPSDPDNGGYGMTRG
jgi:hypothetical protein